VIVELVKTLSPVSVQSC